MSRTPPRLREPDRTPRARAALLALALASACRESSSGPSGDDGPPRYVDVTDRSGVAFDHVNGASGRLYFIETNGSGCGVFDYDGDGDLDLYLVQGGALPGYSSSRPFVSRLYRNDGHLRFTDVTEAARCGATGYGTGCLLADLDGDGWRDAFVYDWGANALLRNKGDGTFEEATKSAGLAAARDSERYAGTACCADFDRDGDLDLFVGNYVKWTLALHKVCAQPPVERSYCHPDNFDPDFGLLYRNNGDGTFSDVTVSAGILRADGKALGSAASDVDGDGDLDLFVANDSMPNFLYRNDGKPGELKFTDVSEISGVSYDRDGRTQGSMGVDFGDVDGDLDQDLIVTNLQMESNALYVNDGHGRFDDQAEQRGITRASLVDFKWGVRFFDFEKDGDLDLLVINGHLHPNVHDYDASQEYEQASKLLLNDGSGRFTLAGPEAGPFFAQRIVGRGLAMADLDDDGDLDLLVSTNNHRALLVECQGRASGHFLGLSLHQPGRDGDAIGARVELRVGARRQVQEVRGAASFASYQDLRLLFGLGAATTADAAIVRWPDGVQEQFGPLAADRYHRLERGKGRPAP